MVTGKLEIITLVVLVVSLILNGVLSWYASRVLGKLTYMYDNMRGIRDMNKSYIKHLEGVNELDTYFGDPVIGELMKHTRFVLEQYESINEIFVDLESGFIVLEEEETEEDAEEEIR